MNFSTAKENYGPLFLAIVCVGIWLVFKTPFPQDPDALFGATATVASVFASFLGVSKALILSIKETPTYKVLKKLNQTNRLFTFLKAGIWSAVFLAALSILGFFISHKATIYTVPWFTIFAGFYIFSGALSLFLFVRITNIFFKLLSQA
jgi:hypothetical protein